MPREGMLERVSGAILDRIPDGQFQRVAGVIPDEVLHDEVSGRGLVIMPDVLCPEIAGFDMAHATGSQAAFKADVGALIDPGENVPIDDQTRVMEEFWRKLGFQVPDLSAPERFAVAEKLEENPGHAALPTPVPVKEPVITQRAVTDPAKVSVDPAETLASRGRRYRRLVASADGVISTPTANYGLGFKTPDGQIAIGQEAYAQSMAKAGKLVFGKDGQAWIFPVVDAQPKKSKEHNGFQIGEIYAGVDSLATTGLLVVVKILQKTQGVIDPELDRSDMKKADDITLARLEAQERLDRRYNVTEVPNQAVYELDSEGNPLRLKSVVVLTSVRPNSMDMRISAIDAQKRIKRGTVVARQVLSGI